MNTWEFLKPDGRVGVCAWCQKEQGVAPRVGESHGICAAHLKGMLAEVGVVRDADGVATVRAAVQQEQAAA